LFAYARLRFGIGTDDAEDLLQETALELLRHRGYVRSPDGFVFAVFRGRCARFARVCQIRREVFTIAASDADAIGSLAPEWIDRQVALRQALGKISSSCRRLLSTYYVEGQSLREAARVMSLQYSSVAKTISRCLKKLRKCLA
jgi:RNA polymerase sigma factor (sigma-70 family)